MHYNYHTHTYHCGHASGVPEDYILRAIENGITDMGFSDHIPFCCPDGVESNYRVQISVVEKHINELCQLREKYKNDIRISIGFESEYYPEQFPQMLRDVRRWGAEYLILGQHFTAPEHPNGTHVSMYEQGDDLLFRYVETAIEGMRSGYFSYLAHPDVIRYTGNSELYKAEMRKICIAARELNLPMEINFYGIRDHRHYPNPIFWEMAGEEKSPVTFGFDSHDVASAYDGESLKTARKMVEYYGLNYIGKPKLVKI